MHRRIMSMMSATCTARMCVCMCMCMCMCVYLCVHNNECMRMCIFVYVTVCASTDAQTHHEHDVSHLHSQDVRTIMSICVYVCVC